MKTTALLKALLLPKGLTHSAKIYSSVSVCALFIFCFADSWSISVPKCVFRRQTLQGKGSALCFGTCYLLESSVHTWGPDTKQSRSVSHFESCMGLFRQHVSFFLKNIQVTDLTLTLVPISLHLFHLLPGWYLHLYSLLCLHCSYEPFLGSSTWACGSCSSLWIFGFWPQPLRPLPASLQNSPLRLLTVKCESQMISRAQKPEQEEIKGWEGTVIRFLAVKTTSQRLTFTDFSKRTFDFWFLSLFFSWKSGLGENWSFLLLALTSLNIVNLHIIIFKIYKERNTGWLQWIWKQSCLLWLQPD